MELRKIGEFVSLEQGLAINKKTNYLVHKGNQHKDSDFHLLRIQDMIDRKYGDVYIDKSVSPKFVSKLSDIIFTRTGQPGLVFRGFNGVIHNNCFKVNIISNILDNDFLYEILGTEFFKKQVLSKINSSIQKDITHNIFKEALIPIFPIEKQKNIAKKMVNIDSLIEVNESKINVLINKIKEHMYAEA